MNKESSQEHKTLASQSGPVNVAIVTVSDTRTEETDINAKYLTEQLKNSHHTVVAYHLIKDELTQVESVLEELVKTEARVIIFNGGTGIAPRDRTFDVINKKIRESFTRFW